MLSKTAIYDVLSDLLDSMTAYLVSASPGPALTVPERSYVTLGQVADDDEQFVISANRIFFGTIESDTITDLKLVLVPRTVAVEIRFLMCAITQDGEDPPSSAELEGNAAAVLEWGIAIGNALINAHKVDQVFSSCAAVGIGSNTPIGPEGGFVGWSQELLVGF